MRAPLAGCVTKAYLRGEFSGSVPERVIGSAEPELTVKV